MRQFRCVWATEIKTPWHATPDVFVYAKTVPNHVKFWDKIKDGATSDYFLMIEPLSLRNQRSLQDIFEGDVAAARQVAKRLKGARAGLGVIGPPENPHHVP